MLMTTTLRSPGPNLYGALQDGDMTTDEFDAVCRRVFKGDPQWGLRAVLKIEDETVAQLFAGTRPVPAPLAIALLRCCHGMPHLKRIIDSQIASDKASENREKNAYAKIMNTPTDLSGNDGRYQRCCEWATMLTRFLLLRLNLVPDHDQ
jgi:hypothetical protein